MKALGFAIARLRETKTGRSRFQFAHDADVHRNSLNQIENGKTATGFVVLLRISQAMGVSMSELIGVYEEELAKLPPVRS